MAIPEGLEAWHFTAKGMLDSMPIAVSVAYMDQNEAFHTDKSCGLSKVVENYAQLHEGRGRRRHCRTCRGKYGAARRARLTPRKRPVHNPLSPSQSTRNEGRLRRARK